MLNQLISLWYKQSGVDIFLKPKCKNVTVFFHNTFLRGDQHWYKRLTTCAVVRQHFRREGCCIEEETREPMFHKTRVSQLNVAAVNCNNDLQVSKLSIRTSESRKRLGNSRESYEQLGTTQDPVKAKLRLSQIFHILCVIYWRHRWLACFVQSISNLQQERYFLFFL